MAVQDIRIEDYTYDLPDERIAKYPLAERDASKLLVYQQGEVKTDVYQKIGNYLQDEALILFNNTRVIPARLILHKNTGGAVEIFCLEPMGELSTGMYQQGSASWKCLVGGVKKWKEGPVSSEWQYDGQLVKLEAFLGPKFGDSYQIDFKWTPFELSFAEILGLAGQIPLPPYLNRSTEDSDRERYQTIYAHHDGSVAAPTAGLHFTDQIFATFQAKNIQPAYLTLHVGAGTFKPVKTETIGEHDMHAEYFEVHLDLLKTIAAGLDQRQIVVVGTTSLRTLESLYLMGCKAKLQPQSSREDLEITQWDAYRPELTAIDRKTAFAALLEWMVTQKTDRLVAKTQLLLAPGYSVQTADALCTNFHQPSSTLLLLVACFIGEDWRKVYDYALANDYRFLSYGDGSLLFRNYPLVVFPS
jgi:S-adenosylmethionine:tRNA ribosyltransferase-isomerase